MDILNEGFFYGAFYSGAVISCFWLSVAEKKETALVITAWTLFCGLGLIASKL